MIHRVFSGGSVVKNPPLVQEMQETRVQSLVQEDPLNKEKTNHSNILACKITCTEEPGGIQSMGLQSWTGLSDRAAIMIYGGFSTSSVDKESA